MQPVSLVAYGNEPAAVTERSTPDAPPTDSALDPGVRRNLRASIIDGSMFSVMVGIGETYVPAFALTLGMGEVVAGLVATLPQLAGGVLQLASPAAVRLLRSHRRWVITCAALQALSFIPLAVAAFLGHIPVIGLFLIATWYWGSGMGTGPSWNTWIGRIVPEHIRTQYFAFRTRLTHGAVLAGLLTGGIALHLGASQGQTLTVFMGMFCVAGVCRALSAWFLYLQTEPPLLQEHFRRVSPPAILSRYSRGPGGRLLMYLLAVQFVVQISGPYFTPYMLKQLELPFAKYMTLTAVSYATKALVSPFIGRLARRVGLPNLLWIGGLGIVPMSAAWIVSDSFGYLLVVQILGGAAWGIYELASLLLFFETIPEGERTSVLTLYNVANALAIILGSITGGTFLRVMGEVQVNYWTLFAVSGSLRVLTLLLLARVPRVPIIPRPLVTRTVTVTPEAGALERPIIPSMRADAAATAE